ncbi:MAG: hypothetical protein EpisKO_06640 [Epibacterium sp.]
MKTFALTVAVMLSLVSPAQAGFDLKHRECIALLDQVYAMPDVIGTLYEEHFSSLAQERSNPSAERKELANHARAMRLQHVEDWKEIAKEVRSYCEGLVF